jgi:hypothetical protein
LSPAADPSTSSFATAAAALAVSISDAVFFVGLRKRDPMPVVPVASSDELVVLPEVDEIGCGRAPNAPGRVAADAGEGSCTASGLSLLFCGVRTAFESS